MIFRRPHQEQQPFSLSNESAPRLSGYSEITALAPTQIGQDTVEIPAIFQFENPPSSEEFQGVVITRSSLDEARGNDPTGYTSTPADGLKRILRANGLRYADNDENGSRSSLLLSLTDYLLADDSLIPLKWMVIEKDKKTITVGPELEHLDIAPLMLRRFSDKSGKLLSKAFVSKFVAELDGLDNEADDIDPCEGIELATQEIASTKLTELDRDTGTTSTPAGKLTHWNIGKTLLRVGEHLFPKTTTALLIGSLAAKLSGRIK